MLCCQSGGILSQNVWLRLCEPSCDSNLLIFLKNRVAVRTRDSRETSCHGIKLPVSNLSFKRRHYQLNLSLDGSTIILPRRSPQNRGDPSKGTAPLGVIVRGDKQAVLCRRSMGLKRARKVVIKVLIYERVTHV